MILPVVPETVAITLAVSGVTSWLCPPAASAEPFELIEIVAAVPVKV